jgi:hypothetical protein
LLISGTTDGSKDGQGFLSGITVNVSSAGTSPVRVNIRKGTTTSGTIAWQGTIENVGHLHDDFAGNINIAAGFYVQVLNPGGAAVRYDVFGCCFGLKAGPRIGAPAVVPGKSAP